MAKASFHQHIFHYAAKNYIYFGIVKKGGNIDWEMRKIEMRKSGVSSRDGVEKKECGSLRLGKL